MTSLYGPGQDTGASATPSGSRPTGQAPTGLDASRFDPSRITGLGVGKSNDWFTPASVFDALGCEFDLDVAAPIGGPLFVPTENWFSHDSLERPWFGFIWMNAPFGGRNGLVPWLDKFFAHGNGIALTPDRTSSPWFHEAWKRADAVMFTRKIRFHKPCGNLGGSPGFGTALWASGPRAVTALNNARASGFGLMTTLASGMETRQGQDRETGLGAEHDSPTRQGDAPTQPLGNPLDTGDGK